MSERKLRVYGGIKECALAENIPLELLQLAKLHPDCPRNTKGFHVSGRIYYGELEPWLNAHRAELEEKIGITLEQVKIENALKDGVLKDLEIAKAREQLIEKEKVKALLKAIASAQTALFNSKFRQELPAKLLGKTVPDMQVIIDHSLADIFGLLNKELERWK